MFFSCLKDAVSNFCKETGRTNLRGVDHVVLSLLCGQAAQELKAGYQGASSCSNSFLHEAIGIDCVNGGTTNIARYEDVDDALDYLERNHPEFNDQLQSFLSTFVYND